MLRADLDHCEWLPDDLKTGEMVFIPGGTFRMGSDHHYPEEAPSHRVAVDGFWIDRTPVTNRQFKQFVDATGHVTEAQIVPDPKDYPGALAEMLYAGSRVFSPLPRITDLTDWSQWWTFLRGANWRHPYGPGSTSRISTIIPSSTSPLAMRQPMPTGPARACRRRRNGNLRRVAASRRRNTPGAMR
jgi:formylglycine-generating enzyme required for sulfatase activity